MKCIICIYDEDGPRASGSDDPRDAVYVVNGLSTCAQHLGEAVCGDLSRALASLREQRRIAEKYGVRR
jgi:hypothetical protein